MAISLAIFHMSGIFSQIQAIFWVVFFFGGSIFIHELGHFLAAKWRKLYVPRFSIGFGPRLFSKKIGQTEFCISLLPLGGYVALPQLMEAKEIEGQYNIPKNCHPITTSDKIITASMGAIFNLIFAFTLACILGHIGIERDYSATNNYIGYIAPEIELSDGTKLTSPAAEAGLKIGDQVVAIDGHKVDNFSDIVHAIALGTNRDSRGPVSSFSIVRDSQIFSITVHPALIEQNKRTHEKLRVVGLTTKQRLKIDKIYKNSPASRTPLSINDRLLKINGTEIASYHQLINLLQDCPKITALFERDGTAFEQNLECHMVPFFAPYIQIETQYGTLELCNDKLQILSADFLKNCRDCAPGQFINHIKIDGKEIQAKDLENYYQKLREATNRPITLEIAGKIYSIIPTKVEWKASENFPSLGIQFGEEHVIIHESPWSQIVNNFRITVQTLSSLIAPSSDVFVKNLMGPAGIIDTLHTFATYSFRLLLWLVILLNVNLAIFNLLPLPVLDGGIIFLAILEKTWHRKIALKVITSVQLAFVVLFLGLIAYISFFDINRILAGHDQNTAIQRQNLLYVSESSYWNNLMPVGAEPASANEYRSK